MGFGVCSVRGRRRVPCPPASRMAFMTTADLSRLFAVESSRSTVNLPNSLTVARIFLVPLLVVVLLTNFDGLRVFGVSKETLGATIFAIASFTDWLDGYLARRRK